MKNSSPEVLEQEDDLRKSWRRIFEKIRRDLLKVYGLSPKTNLTISSTEFCQAIFDEGDIRLGLGGCSGHGAMISLLQKESTYT